MQIVQNRAVLVDTRTPNKITEVIPKAAIVRQIELPNGQLGSTVAVNWTLRNTKILHNLGFKKVPSPITGDYEWPGLYTPFDHQKKTAEFLTMHQKAFCLNDLGCVDSETEYLSPTGWVKISEYESGQVAQYDPKTGAIEFVEPEGYLKKPCSDMIHFKTKYGIDQMLSPEHRMLIHDKKSKIGKWVVSSAQEMQERHDCIKTGIKVRKSRNSVGFYSAACPAVYTREWGDGLPLTEEQLRVQVAVIADGHFPGNTLRCVVRLKKQRKIERLRTLLLAAGIAFTVLTPEYASAKGFQVFKFYAPMHCKFFGPEFYSCSKAQIDVIYDEVLHWDGTMRKGNRFGEFTTTSKNSADFIQAVFNSKGHVARVLQDNRADKYNDGICYSVNIRGARDGLLQYYATTSNTVSSCASTDGYKYCFTVPTSFLLFRRNGCVFASGNTGKSCSVAWAADYLLTKKVIKRVLIVAPLSILDCAWRSDLFKTLMHRRVDIAHGSQAKRRVVIESDAEFVIINYDGLDTMINELLRGGFDLIVCDEATAIQNVKTVRWKRVNQLVGPQTWLWLLTGTPAAQSPDRAYGLAKLVNPNGVPKYHVAFKEQVMQKLTQFKYIPRPEAQKIIHKAMQPAIRFTKEECLDLPEMTYVDREVPLSSQQQKYYDKLKKELLIQAAGQEITAMNAAVEMNKLLQLSVGSVYSSTGEVVEFDCTNRLNEMVNIIEQAGHKVLIFANFSHTIDIIQRHLCKHDITNGTINGDVPLRKRSELIEKFQKTADPHVLVIQPQAASHGITLHAADTVIWFGPIMSLEYYLQANARVHRAGQKNPCTVVHLMGSGVEKQIYKRLQNKKEDQDGLLAMYKNILGIA